MQRSARQWFDLCAGNQECTLQAAYGVYSFIPSTNDPVGSELFFQANFGLSFLTEALEFISQLYAYPFRSGTLVDIGANIGTTSIQAILSGKVRRAIALEPDPQHFKFLRRNIENNRLEDRILPLPLAVSSRRAPALFARSSRNTADNHIHSMDDGLPVLTGAETSQIITVRANTLDNILEDLPPSYTAGLSAIWLDVQGHEALIFQGAPKTFSRDLPVVAEVNPATIIRAGLTPEEYCATCRGYWKYFWLHTADGFKKFGLEALPHFLDYLYDGPQEYDVIYANR